MNQVRKERKGCIGPAEMPQFVEHHERTGGKYEQKQIYPCSPAPFSLQLFWQK